MQDSLAYKLIISTVVVSSLCSFLNIMYSCHIVLVFQGITTSGSKSVNLVAYMLPQPETYYFTASDFFSFPFINKIFYAEHYFLFVQAS
jgi:hypothetical protein